MGRKKRRSKQFKDSSKVIDMQKAREERQARRKAAATGEKEQTRDISPQSSARQTSRKMKLRRRKGYRRVAIIGVCALILLMFVVSVGRIVMLKHELYQAQKQQEEYKKVCKPYHRSLQEQRNFTIDNITDVGLITGGSETNPIQGASDFINQLNKNLKDPQHLHIEYVKMSNIEEIISALNRLNATKMCQVIAIVRGGGSPEALACYSNPQLVKAVYESPIPVVTGIGHKSDYLLCKQAARHDGQTPTGAAKFINHQYFLRYSRQRDRYQAKTEYHRIEANATKDELLAANDALMTELQFVQQENQLLQQKIEELKHRSFISRLFNLG